MRELNLFDLPVPETFVSFLVDVLNTTWYMTVRACNEQGNVSSMVLYTRACVARIRPVQRSEWTKRGYVGFCRAVGAVGRKAPRAPGPQHSGRGGSVCARYAMYRLTSRGQVHYVPPYSSGEGHYLNIWK